MSLDHENREHQSPNLSAKPGMRTVVREMKDRAEAQLIQDALDANGWNRRHAARYLNISYRGLLYKIQQHRLSPSRASMVRPFAGL